MTNPSQALFVKFSFNNKYNSFIANVLMHSDSVEDAVSGFQRRANQSEYYNDEARMIRYREICNVIRDNPDIAQDAWDWYQLPREERKRTVSTGHLPATEKQMNFLVSLGLRSEDYQGTISRTQAGYLINELRKDQG